MSLKFWYKLGQLESLLNKEGIVIEAKCKLCKEVFYSIEFAMKHILAVHAVREEILHKCLK